MNKLFIALFLIVFAAQAQFCQSGWHVFRVIEQDSMQYLESTIQHFGITLSCSQQLAGEELWEDAAALANEVNAFNGDKPIADLPSKMGYRSYLKCKSGQYASSPWSGTEFITYFAIGDDGYNLTVEREWRE